MSAQGFAGWAMASSLVAAAAVRTIVQHCPEADSRNLMSLPRMNEKANRGKNPAARSAASTAAPLASHPLSALDPHPAGQGQREERGYRDQPI